MRFIVLIIAILGRLHCFSQEIDTVKLNNNRVVRNGYVILSQKQSTRYINPIAGIDIYTFNPSLDSAFSFLNGKVVDVRMIDSESLCIIKSGKFLYTYTNLKSCALSKGLDIRSGDFIGCMSVDGNNMKVFRIIISKRNKIL